MSSPFPFPHAGTLPCTVTLLFRWRPSHCRHFLNFPGLVCCLVLLPSLALSLSKRDAHTHHQLHLCLLNSKQMGDPFCKLTLTLTDRASTDTVTSFSHCHHCSRPCHLLRKTYLCHTLPALLSTLSTCSYPPSCPFPGSLSPSFLPPFITPSLLPALLLHIPYFPCKSPYPLILRWIHTGVPSTSMVSMPKLLLQSHSRCIL